VHRSRSHQIWCLTVAGLCAIVALGAIVVGAGKSDPLRQIVFALVFFGLAAAGVRWSRASVDTSGAQALVVRNPLRTHVVPWALVSGFETGPSSMPNSAPRRLVKVRLTDGSLITCVGACPWGDTVALKMAEELNRAHDWSTAPLTERDRDTIRQLEATGSAQDER
jgi:hypothetical protein